MRGSRQAAHARRQPGGPPPRDADVEALDLHVAADRLRSIGRGFEQRGQPAWLHLGVGVGRDDQTVGRARGQETLAGDLHAKPSRGSDTEWRALDDVQAQIARRLQGALARRVGAAVEDEDDRVGVGRHLALRRDGPQAPPDAGLLIARRYGDDRSQRAHPPSSSRWRPAS